MMAKVLINIYIRGRGSALVFFIFFFFFCLQKFNHRNPIFLLAVVVVGAY